MNSCEADGGSGLSRVVERTVLAMKEGTRLDALAVTYCLAAAACGTLAGSLTVLGTGCASLLLIGTVLRLWGHKPSPLRSACALLPAAALAAAVPRLVALARPDWLPAGIRRGGGGGPYSAGSVPAHDRAGGRTTD